MTVAMKDILCSYNDSAVYIVLIVQYSHVNIKQPAYTVRRLTLINRIFPSTNEYLKYCLAIVCTVYIQRCTSYTSGWNQ